jgi:2-dehydro-3-deoxyphosphogluconate aldolase/(4S)-4-hydroxy-2-oxoglutarate aldolase
MGSNLITKQLIANQDYDGIEKKVRDTIQLIKAIRRK